MISKAEALQKLKKAGYLVAEDQSIVTVLLAESVSFAGGIKEIKKKLAEMGYEASFCVKQSKTKLSSLAEQTKEIKDSIPTEGLQMSEKISEEEITEEEWKGYLLSEDSFALDEDGQFRLGFEE